MEKQIGQRVLVAVFLVVLAGQAHGQTVYSEDSTLAYIQIGSIAGADSYLNGAYELVRSQSNTSSLDSPGQPGTNTNPAQGRWMYSGVVNSKQVTIWLEDGTTAGGVVTWKLHISTAIGGEIYQWSKVPTTSPPWVTWTQGIGSTGVVQVDSFSNDGSWAHTGGGGDPGSAGLISYLNSGGSVGSLTNPTNPDNPTTPAAGSFSGDVYYRQWANEPSTSDINVWSNAPIGPSQLNLPTVESHPMTFHIPISVGGLPNPFATTGFTGIDLSTNPAYYLGAGPGSMYATINTVRDYLRLVLSFIVFVWYFRSILRILTGLL